MSMWHDELLEECSEREYDQPELMQVLGSARAVEFLARRVFLRSEWVLVGVAFILNYHAMVFWDCCNDKTCCGKGTRNGSTWLRTIGRQLVILQFYYCRSPWLEIFNENPLIFGLVVVLLDVFFMKRFTRFLQVRSQRLSRRDFENMIILPDEPIKSKYMDFSRGWGTVVLTFFCQVMLFILFYLYVNADTVSHDRCNIMVVAWIVSVAVVLEAGLEEAGDAYHPELWEQVKNELEKKDYDFQKEFRLRRTFDFLVNSFVREALLGVTPIILCVESPIDIVKDVLAVFFICKFDDLDDAMSIKDMVNDRLHPKDYADEY